MEVDVDQPSALDLASHPAEGGELCGWLTTAVHIHVLLDHMSACHGLPLQHLSAAASSTAVVVAGQQLAPWCSLIHVTVPHAHPTPCGALCTVTVAGVLCVVAGAPVGYRTGAELHHKWGPVRLAPLLDVTWV